MILVLFVISVFAEHPICSFKISEFTLGKLLGSGGYGSVFYTTNPKNSSEEYALKCIALQSNGIDEMEHQIQLEVRNQMKIESPFVTRLYCVYYKRSNVYLLMELVSGGDLSQLVSRRRTANAWKLTPVGKTLFQTSEIRLYASQILLGLKAMHDEYIAHRDLKLENILIDSNNNLKISDFGLSTSARNVNFNGKSESICKSKSTCGTLFYMAPEVRANLYTQKGYDAIKADIWSFGIMLYALVLGRLPMTRSQYSCLKRPLKKNGNFLFFLVNSCKNLNNPFEDGRLILPGLPPSNLKLMLQSMLSQDPEARPSVDALMEDPFFEGIDWYSLNSQSDNNH